MATFLPLTCPVGTVIDYAGASVPPGWLECDGRVRVEAHRLSGGAS